MKRWLRRISPDPKTIRENRYLRVFGTLLHNPNLWYLNRRSVSGAVAAGLFAMYMPPFGQPIMAATLAIAFRVNLPVAVSLIWLSNPLTIPPMYYFAYRLGSWLLARPPVPFEVDYWLQFENWLAVLGPVLLGCLICASLCAAVGYIAVQGLWRWNLHRQIRQRRARYTGLGSRLNAPSSSRNT